LPNTLLEVENLKKYFPVERPSLFSIFSKRKDVVRAVDGVSFSIKKGETFGLVGESGSGKTTIGRLVLRLIEPTGGKIVFDGRELEKMDKKEMRKFRRNAQIIFQDPYSSLNPRMTVRNTIGEGLKVHNLAKGAEKWEKVAELMEEVGLSPTSQYIDRYPHQFSGGQRQRIGIARALAVDAIFIVADEPVSELDVSIRANILNLMQGLKEKLGLTYLFIAHDLAVIRHVSDCIGVIYLGKMMEQTHAEDLLENIHHPYTEALLGAFPVPDLTIERKRIALKGEIPSSINPPPGCVFHTRCPYTIAICKKKEPELVDVGKGNLIACHMRTK